MISFPDVYGIIPARYASSRFPGKPLARIKGRPMFWHVYTRSVQCSFFKKVVLATDDRRIQEKAIELNIPVVMTRRDHESGTDRVLEAAIQMNAADNSIVVNIQGDEPLIKAAMLTSLIKPFENPAVRVTTLATPISYEEAKDPNTVKVVCDNSDRALYFSRSIIPYCRDRDLTVQYFGHIGLYAFRMSALKFFVESRQGTLEKIEKLEQLRFLENGIPIVVVETKEKTVAVDVPEDIYLVEKQLEKSDWPD